jgi:hypothetical protein
LVAGTVAYAVNHADETASQVPPGRPPELKAVLSRRAATVTGPATTENEPS